jgi:hypothetical protein
MKGKVRKKGTEQQHNKNNNRNLPGQSRAYHQDPIGKSVEKQHKTLDALYPKTKESNTQTIPRRQE